MAPQKLPPVTYEHLKQIFTSRDFLRGLNKAVKTAFDRETESHFSMYREVFSDKTKYFFPDKTTLDLPASTSFELTPEQYQKIDRQKLMPIIHYHCHPCPYASPSVADLTFYFDIRNQQNLIVQDDGSWLNIDNPHLDCIGAIREGGKFHDVLVFQNRSQNPVAMEGEFAYQYIEDTLGRRDGENHLVAEVLDGLRGWNGHLLTYERNGRNYSISGAQLSGLEKFAYVPKLIPED